MHEVWTSKDKHESLIRAVPFYSVGGRRNGRFFEGGGGGGEGPNCELLYTIRLSMISGRRGGGGVSNF